MAILLYLVIGGVIGVCYGEDDRLPVSYHEFFDNVTLTCPEFVTDSIHWRYTAYMSSYVNHRIVSNEPSKRDEPFISDPRKYRLDANMTLLHINNVSYYDIGLYECSTFYNFRSTSGQIVRLVTFSDSHVPPYLSCYTVPPFNIKWSMVPEIVSNHDIDRKWISMVDNVTYPRNISVSGKFMYFRSVDGNINSTVSCDVYSNATNQLSIKILIRVYWHDNMCMRKYPPYCMKNCTCTYDHGASKCACPGVYANTVSGFDLLAWYIGIGVAVGIVCVGAIILSVLCIKLKWYKYL